MKRRDEESSPSDTLTPKKQKTRLAGKVRTYLWACPLHPHPYPHRPFPCFCKINMRGSSKMARIDAVRTTRYPLILMLCCDVFIFLVKWGVPCDEDFECLYSSCLLNGKTFFRAFLSIANKRYKWCVTKSVYVVMTVFLTGGKKKKKKDLFCSCMWAWNFRVKRYIIGIHNAMAQIGLETNS